MSNPFIPKEHEPRLNNVVWDKYYIDRELKDCVVKTGEGEEDFTIVKKVVETKRSIKETIDSQADDVGLENVLRKYAITGDPGLLPQSVAADDTIVDMSDMPQDLIDVHNYYAKYKAMYDSLPDAIRKGRSFGEFMANFTQNEFDAYANSLRPKEEPNPAKKEGE